MKDNDLKIGFVGAGNMAQAIITGLLKAGHAPNRIMVADPVEEQRARINALNSDIRIAGGNADAAEFAELLVLAVKPQLMADVAGELAGIGHTNTLVVSIAAGITLQHLQGWFGAHAPIVRVMPNQPALVGAGMSVLIANGPCGRRHREQAEYVTLAVGRSAWIDDESLMDAVTAISGSGPAYFYLLIEIMSDCARDMGLPAKLARLLARQTAHGAGLSALLSDETTSALRQSVTSPGGTTAAALEVLENRGIRDIFSEALEAARLRSKELGKD
jgi:pyrroline-5-carboxylate reductase